MLFAELAVAHNERAHVGPPRDQQCQGVEEIAQSLGGGEAADGAHQRRILGHAQFAAHLQTIPAALEYFQRFVDVDAVVHDLHAAAVRVQLHRHVFHDDAADRNDVVAPRHDPAAPVRRVLPVRGDDERGVGVARGEVRDPGGHARVRVYHVYLAFAHKVAHAVRHFVHGPRRLAVDGQGHVLDAALLQPVHQRAAVGHHGHVVPELLHAQRQRQHVRFHAAHVQLGQHVHDV